MTADTNDPKIRSCTPSGLPALEAVIDATEPFPSKALDDMVSFEPPPGTADDPRELRLVHDDGAGAMAVAYAAPERMTYALARREDAPPEST